MESNHLIGVVVLVILVLVLVWLIVHSVVRLQHDVCKLRRCCKKNGKRGPRGPCGKPGCDGKGSRNCIDWSEFYAAQDAGEFENNNPLPIQPGEAIAFPHVGVASGSGNIIIDSTVTPLGTAIRLKKAGTYQVDFAVMIGEPGQLVVALDDGNGLVEQEADYLGTQQAGLLSEQVLITTVIDDVNLLIVNPANQTTPITIVAGAGSTGNASHNAHLTITRIA